MPPIAPSPRLVATGLPGYEKTMSNPHPYQFYANGGWQEFSAAATPLIDAEVGTEQAWEVTLPAKKKKSERRIRRQRTHAPDGTALTWGQDGNALKLPGVHIWQFFHTKASFFKRMRAIS